MSNGALIHEVGHHLQKFAVSTTEEDRDAFARSAFNRYYYGAFLNVRNLLGSLDPAWSALAHAGYPEVLKGKVRKRLNQSRERARKNGDSILVGRIDAAKRASSELAKIMKTAYGIRVVADYEPEEAVSFKKTDRFSLRSVDVSTAHQWQADTRVLCGEVSKVWDEIYG